MTNTGSSPLLTAAQTLVAVVAMRVVAVTTAVVIRVVVAILRSLVTRSSKPNAADATNQADRSQTRKSEP